MGGGWEEGRSREVWGVGRRWKWVKEEAWLGELWEANQLAQLSSPFQRLP